MTRSGIRPACYATKTSGCFRPVLAVTGGWALIAGRYNPL